MHQIHIGITFSDNEINYLKQSPQKAWKEAMLFPFNSYRLCAYWNTIQPEKNTWNDTSLVGYIQQLEEIGKTCIVALGQKSPRWPEFHVPVWVKNLPKEAQEEALLTYLDKLVRCLKQYACITHWQLENEPFDASGPQKRIISEQILISELQLVRSIDSRPIVGTLWGNTLSLRNNFPKIQRLYDVVGLHLYFRTPLFPKIYLGPLDSIGTIKNIIGSTTKPVWITELQAEPWDFFHPEDKSKKRTESMSAHRVMTHFNTILPLSCERIYFWGYEYWYFLKMRQDLSYWNSIHSILDTAKKTPPLQ